MYYQEKDGEIIRTTPFERVAETWGEYETTDKEIVRGYDGKFYFKGDEPVYEPTYAKKRVAEYPSIADQLDMLYWDKVNGTNNWQETIAEIKAKYPKE